jgi:phosphatidylglycerophosphate synthase
VTSDTVPTVRTGPVIGLAAQAVLLAALARTVGLGVAGTLAGIAYGLVMYAALTRGLNRSGLATLGQADRVTLVRATLVGAVTALTVDSFTQPAPVAVLVGIAIVALVLDAVDGKVARRTGTATAFGARFDMEVDAFLILVLSAYTAGLVGGWVLAIGAMRYAYVAAAWILPWLRGSLPRRYWWKAVAATQGIVLVVAAADVLPRPLTAAAVAASLALLIASFGNCIWWLWCRRPARPGHEPAAAAAHEQAAVAAPEPAVRGRASGRRHNAPAPRAGDHPLPAAAGTPATLVHAPSRTPGRHTP